MDYFEHNRQSWNELTSLHVESSFYELEAFKKGNNSLNHIELEELGDIRGKKILHLQCHFGMDSLSLARLGAEVTGIDISDASIKKAKELSKEIDIPATFIRSNIYDIKIVSDDSFDIIFTSYGAINWLNDLDKWAKIIQQNLKPDGKFYMIEFHPFIYTLNDDWEITDTYFNNKELVTTVKNSYTDNSNVSKNNLKHVEWHHSISEVINSLISNGLNIDFLNEFPYQVYNCFPNLIETEKGKWVSNKFGDKIPYMYSLQARKI